MRKRIRRNLQIMQKHIYISLVNQNGKPIQVTCHMHMFSSQISHKVFFLPSVIVGAMSTNVCAVFNAGGKGKGVFAIANIDSGAKVMNAKDSDLFQMLNHSCTPNARIGRHGKNVAVTWLGLSEGYFVCFDA